MSKTVNMQTEYAMLTRLLLSLTLLGLIISIPVYKYKRTQERKAAETHQRIHTLQKEIDSLSNDSKAEMQKKLNELQQQGEIIKGKDQEIEQLKKDLQAKRENQKRIAEEQAKQLAAQPAPKPVAVASGGCELYRGILSQYGWNVDTAMFVMSKESGCNPNAISPTNDHGLFQLNNTMVYDPAQNIAIAWTKYVSGRVGSNNWSAWYAVCTPGNYPQPKYPGIKCQ